jgi:hypothetical protein
VDDREKAERRKAEKQKADWEKVARGKEARDQERQEQEREREHNLQEFRDRCFEVQKHVATLSTAASLVILAVYRERPFEDFLLAITLLLLAISVVLAVEGMTFQARDVRDQVSLLGYDRHIELTTTGASNFLIMAVVGLAFFLFHIPLWIAIGVLGLWVGALVVWVVVYLLITLIRY